MKTTKIIIKKKRKRARRCRLFVLYAKWQQIRYKILIIDFPLSVTNEKHLPARESTIRCSRKDDKNVKSDRNDYERQMQQQQQQAAAVTAVDI